METSQRIAPFCLKHHSPYIGWFEGGHHRVQAAVRGGRTLVVLLVILAGGFRGVLGAQAIPEVSKFDQFYKLTAAQAAPGAPVRLKGTLLCYDLGWNQFYIYDGEQVAWLSPRQFPTNLHAGAQIELSGATTWVQGAPGFTNLQLKVLGEGPLPKPKALEISQLGSDFGQWVQTSGRVRVADTSSGRLGLILQDKGKTCLVYVMGSAETNDFSSLLGCQVKVAGINASKVTGTRLESAALTAPNWAAITLLERADAKLAEAPPTSVETLLSRKLGVWTNEPVKLAGSILSYKPGELLVLKDATGVIRAGVIQTSEARDGQRVEVSGYFTVSSGEVMLRDAYFVAPRAEAVAKGPATAQPATPRSAGTAEITDSRAIARMSREQAAEGLPVRLQGVVTYADPEWKNSFVQDQSGGIYVDLNQPDVVAGQVVEVTGRTSRGGFAPEVVESHLRILGTTNLPVPVKTDLQELADGHLDSHWVQMQGVVRRVTRQWGHVTLTLSTPKGRFNATFLLAGNQNTATNLIDALVEVRGVCASEMNAQGQLTGVILYVPDLGQISLLEGAAANPFEVATQKIATVGTFDPSRLAGRRIKVSGVVTLILPDQGIYVQDESGGIRVNGLLGKEVRVGDAVEVLGFPVLGSFSPGLEEAMVRRTGSTARPAPLVTSVENILTQGANDGAYVQLEAHLFQRAEGAARPRLLLQSGAVIFPATLMSSPAGQSLAKLRVGSILRLKGVSVIQAGESHEPESFRLLVADMDDITLLKSPPWWTVPMTLTSLGIVALGGILVWVWSRSLRRRVEAQTQVIRRNEQQLITVSRQAGMAEVATSVLHNVGNVLNSVNISVQVATAAVHKSKVTSVKRLATLLQEKSSDLGGFLTQDPKGRALPEYLATLGDHLVTEQAALLEELKSLGQNVQHINDVVAMQQNFARAGGVTEIVKVSELIDDAVRMNAGGFQRHHVQIIRDYDAHTSPELTVDRHKVLQILVNLVSNAKYACSASGQKERRVTFRVSQGDGKVSIACVDNGIGIPPENLERIFNHGFTTKKDGHGFGLHGAANVAREMGGRLFVHSDGVGRGATFTLELPLQRAS